MGRARFPPCREVTYGAQTNTKNAPARTSISTPPSPGVEAAAAAFRKLAACELLVHPP